MDSSRQLWIAAALIVAFSAIVLLMTSPDGRLAQDVRLTSFRTTPDGVGALYRLADSMGVPVDRRLSPYRDGAPLDDPIVLFHPTYPLTPGEVGEMMRWLREGGTLFYIGYDASPVLDSLQLDLEILPPDDILDLSCIAETATALPHRWTEGVERIPELCRGFSPVGGTDGTSLPEGAEILLESPELGPIAMTFPVGAGRVVAFSDARLFQNEWIGETSAATIFVRAALDRVPEGSSLYFDEFHQGFGSGGGVIRSTTRFLIRHPWGRALSQLLLAATLLLVLLARRLGRPDPPARHARRTPLEHVAALAESYRQARATKTVRVRLVQGLARQLRKSTPAGAEEATRFVDSLHGIPGAAEEGIAVRTVWSDPKSDPNDLAQRIDQLLERVHSR